uniref:Uncharacterized protein n=1 Tax=Anguilla anguilla TaxID=7936 RepID=A0A0E9QHY6_ANGAN
MFIHSGLHTLWSSLSACPNYQKLFSHLCSNIK